MATLKSLAKNTLSSARSTMNTVRKSATSTIRNTASRTASSFSSSGSKSSSGGSSIIGSLASGLGSALKSSSSSGRNSYKSVTSAARNGSSSASNLLSSVTGAIKSGTKSSKTIINNLTTKYANNKSTGSTNSFNSLVKSVGTNVSNTAKKGGNVLTSLSSIFNSNSKSKGNIASTINTLKNDLKSRTNGSSFFSNLLGKRNSGTGTTAGSSKATTISPLNVFGGLKNLISGAKGNVTQGDGTTRLNTMGLLGLSTTLGSVSQRMQDSFNSWKSKLGLLPMSGKASENANNATNQMTSLFDRFKTYSQDMSKKLFGFVGGAQSADVAGASDDLSGGSGLLGKVGNLLGGSKSSTSSTTGSSSMNNALTSKSDVERWAALHGVSNTKTWGCLLFASARTGIPCMYGHAKYAVADGGLMYKMLGYEVGTTPKPGALCLHGTHAQCVEGVNADGSINTSEANHHHDFAAQQHYNPPAGTIYVYPKTGLAGLI